MVPGHAVGVGNGSAEEVEGGADGEVYPPLAQFFCVCEVFKTGSTAGVGDGQGGFGSQHADEILVHAGFEPFNIGGVDEEFRTVIGHERQRFSGDREVGGRLPAVHGHTPVGIPPAATEIDHQTGRGDEVRELFEAFRLKAGVFVE